MKEDSRASAVILMSDRELLMIPGPTNVTPAVLAALSRPPESHVGGRFAVILKETLSYLGKILKTDGLILPLAGTGTLAEEVALRNVIEPGDNVLAISGGFFGDRLADAAATLGAKVDKLEVPEGAVVDPRDVKRKLASGSYKALIVVHVDTSTGATNPIQELGKVATEAGVLYVVDAVCSVGAMNIEVDAWGIDVCFTASQKGLGIPPGLAIIAFSQRALKVREERKSPMYTFYCDLKKWAPVMKDPTTYFSTHPVNMIVALHESCKTVLSEGLEARFARHANMAAAFRSAMKAIGLRLLCEERDASSTVTVVFYPEGIEDGEFRKTMAEKYGIIVAGARGKLGGKVFRVGHMSNVNRNDLFATIAAVEGSLAEHGYKFDKGAGVGAAIATLASK